MKIIKQEIQFEESLKQRLEFINDVYISNLSKKIKLSELETYLKSI